MQRILFSERELERKNEGRVDREGDESDGNSKRTELTRDSSPHEIYAEVVADSAKFFAEVVDDSIKRVQTFSK